MAKSMGAPEQLISQFGLTAQWGVGNKMILHAFKNPSTYKNGGGIMDSKPVTVLQWDSNLYRPSMRQLINESFAIFRNVQTLETEGGSNAVKPQLLKFSRQYRSCIKACIENMSAAADNSGASASEDLEIQSHILYKIELVWNLCEIMFVDIQPGGIILAQLLEWVRLHFPQCGINAKQALEADCPELHPTYWDSIYGYVLQGRLEEARKLLRVHLQAATDPFAIMDELLCKMPVYTSYGGQSVSEFDLKWRHWQDECIVRLDDGEFSADVQLETLAKILCGDTETFQSLGDVCETWYHLMVSYLLFTNPIVKMFDLRQAAEDSIDVFGGMPKLSTLDAILLAVIENDVHRVIKECHTTLDNSWFTAHLTDLLYHSELLREEQLKYLSDLREFLLLDFAAALMSHSSLWQVGAEYFDHCPVAGRVHLQLFLQKLSPTTERRAQKIIAAAAKRDMPEIVSSVCKVMGRRALQQDQLGTALSWALRSKDTGFVSYLADVFIKEYCDEGRFSCLDLLDNLGPSMLLSDRLTFLGKYREFHIMYEKEEFKEAAALLVSLMSSRLAPKYFWMTLLLDAVPLLEAPKLIFSSEQTHELMYCLEELSKEEVKNGQKATITEQHNLIRLALARNLAKAIIAKS